MMVERKSNRSCNHRIRSQLEYSGNDPDTNSPRINSKRVNSLFIVRKIKMQRRKLIGNIVITEFTEATSNSIVDGISISTGV